MSLLSLESSSIARVGYSSSARFTEKIYVGDIDSNGSIGAGGTILKTDRITLNATAGDVGTPVAGDLWYNATSGKLKYYHGSTVYELADTSSSGIPNPGTKANNDLLQYVSGSSLWDAKGGGSGDRLGPIFGGAVDLAGHLTFTDDNTYDIGASGATRPKTGHFGTSVVINGQTAMKATDAASGDLSGTYPGPTVAKVNNYTMEAGAPTKGDAWRYSGSQWSHRRSDYRVLASATTSGSNLTKNVLSYTAAANEFSATTQLMWIIESYNPSSIGMYPIVKQYINPTTRTFYTMTQYTYQHNLVHISVWSRPDSSTYEQHLQENYGGKEAGTTTVVSDFMSAAATWYLDFTFGTGGTAYVRVYLVAVQYEAF